jgi:hypothetical protein
MPAPLSSFVEIPRGWLEGLVFGLKADPLANIDTSLIQFVIPGLTLNLGCFRIHAFAGMAKAAVMNDVVYSSEIVL